MVWIDPDGIVMLGIIDGTTYFWLGKTGTGAMTFGMIMVTVKTKSDTTIRLSIDWYKTVFSSNRNVH